MKILKNIFMTFMILATASTAYAGAAIESPAGPAPSQESTVVGVGGLPMEKSKSKVIPLLGVMNVAAGKVGVKSKEVKIKDYIKPRPAKGLVLSQTEQRQNETAPPAAAEKAEPALFVPRATADLNEVNAPKGQELAPAAVDIPATAETQNSNPVDPWDSAATRLDQEESKLSPKTGVQLEDIVEPTAEYRYSASKRANPFIPPHSSQRVIELGSSDVEIPIISPLQAFALSQLVVIGVWEGSDRRFKAIIQTPTDQGIEVGLGDPAGNSGGRIMSISQESVAVREFSIRLDGAREYRDVLLSIGGSKPVVDEANPGGRLILRPGASAAEMDAGSATSQAPSAKPNQGAQTNERNDADQAVGESVSDPNIRR